MVIENKNKVIELLRSTNRQNITKILRYLENTDFYIAPASTKYHGSYEGGLCEHSLNVYEQAIQLYDIECKIQPNIKNLINVNNIIISSLLHDVCKINLYNKIKKWKKDSNDKWVEYETYESTYQDLPVGHGEKSVIRILQNEFPLEECEILAIRWHMSSFDLSDSYETKQSFNEACSKTPLLPILMCADNLATRITELSC